MENPTKISTNDSTRMPQNFSILSVRHFSYDNVNHLTCKLTCTYKIKIIITSVNKKHSAGYFAYSTPVIKYLSGAICPIVSYFCIHSILTGTLSNKIKYVTVITLLNKGSTDDVDNYRSISLLAAL